MTPPRRSRPTSVRLTPDEDALWLALAEHFGMANSRTQALRHILLRVAREEGLIPKKRTPRMRASNT